MARRTAAERIGERLGYGRDSAAWTDVQRENVRRAILETSEKAKEQARERRRVHLAAKRKRLVNRRVEKERRRQLDVKVKLADAAGSKGGDVKAMYLWAGDWQPKVLRDGAIHWDQVTEAAPCPAAVGLLEDACNNPKEFWAKYEKILGKTSDLGDDALKWEKKREADLVRMLQEAVAESQV